MKNLLQIIIPVILFLLLAGCKKESANNRSASNSSLSFNYNGKQYTLTYVREGVQPWGADETSIDIDAPDIFNGKILFPRPGCAYFQPVGRYIDINADCDPSYVDGLPGNTDSIYIYQNGSVSLSYSNCTTKSGYDIVTGTNYSYHLCDGNGTFELTLKNKKNETIVLTNGQIRLYNIIRP